MKNFTYVMLLVFCGLFSLQSNAQQVFNEVVTYRAGTFDEGAAEIVAYDGVSKRLFVTNAENDAVDIVSIAIVDSPMLVSSIDITVYGEGVNSVAVSNEVVAIAVEGDDQQPGKVVLFDTDGTFIAEYTTGALPDMVTFSRDGNYVLVANEGEPSDDYLVDPEGGVTVVNITSGASTGVVTQLDFNAFDSQIMSLKNAGVRIFGPDASVSQDLEPEYITTDPVNTGIAYVICQENNALIAIDFVAGSVLDILPLGYKDHNAGSPELTEYAIDQIPNLPSLGAPVYDGGQPAVALGGFSAIYYDGTESTPSNYVFYTVPDRGPNEGAVSSGDVTPAPAQNLRPFKLPNYQARIVKIEVDPVGGTVSLDENEQIFLVGPDGRTPISGRGNAPGIDEVPVTFADAATDFPNVDFTDNGGEEYHLLEYDAFGGDFEGIVRDPFGNFWMNDEYRPAIYAFNDTGRMVARFIPEGTKKRVITNTIFFSEWGEGSSDNKYIEIYNGTGNTINLEDFLLVNCGNSCAVPGEFEFDNSPLFAGRTLEHGEVFVIAHPNAQPDILSQADTTFQFLSNGNDYWAILNASDSSVVDQVGDILTSGLPSGWDVAGVPTATANSTLIRKHYILEGSNDWAASAGTNAVDSEWIVEERPTADTVLASLGTHLDLGTESLPAVYGTRRPNRGFEAIALDTTNLILYSFIQSPMYNPDNSTRNNSDVIRILGIDPLSGDPVSEYVYLLEKNRHPGVNISRVDKIGDAVFIGNDKFRVLERDSSVPGDKGGKKFIFEINLTGATNILGTALSMRMEGNGTDTLTLEQMTAEQLRDSGIVTVAKRKILNLPSIGYFPSDKPEGLAILPQGQMAVLNDNDFGLAGAGVSDASTLGIISFDDNYGLDASNRDDSIIIQNWPVLGMYQPDAIKAAEIDGDTYIFTANEGDAREYFDDLNDNGDPDDGEPQFIEEDRIGDVDLNPTYFADPSILQENENLGRLKLTLTRGDLDGDGNFEELYSFGARSFSIWDNLGNLVWDSGDDFEQITAAAIPDDFNSTNDENDSFDNRSDDKGPEPEAIEVADLDTATYVFIGFERVGGIAAYRVNDVTSPEFVEYETNRNFAVPVDSTAAGDLAPEDIIFISANESPNGEPLIAVANEVSGTVTLYQLFNRFIPTSNEQLVEEIALFAYPNPVSGDELFLNKKGSYTVFNLVGQQLARAENTESIDVSSLQTGVYIVRSDKSEVVRFVKK
ncbi:MAG: esterase-like activity of phytase family protein [Bacteroidota bacterium]